MLRTSAAGVVLVAFPLACGDRPLPNEQVVGGTSGASGGVGGGASGEGGTPGVGGGTGSGSTCSPAVTAGPASAIAVGTLSIVGQMVLGRDAGGLYAMSGLCTHQGCLVTVVGAPGQQTLACPCHGSAFDGNGAVTRGPAGVPLRHYQVLIVGAGETSICTGVAVANTARTPIP
jgi:Rieske Fe-S protein